MLWKEAAAAQKALNCNLLLATLGLGGLTYDLEIDTEVLRRRVLEIHTATVGAFVFVSQVFDPQQRLGFGLFFEASSSTQAAGIVPMPAHL